MRRTFSILCVLACAAVCQAEPPSFNPPDVITPQGGVGVYMPPADCVGVEYFGVTGENQPFNAATIGGSKTAFMFFTNGLPDGRYEFWGVASSKTGEQVKKRFAVVKGTPQDPTKPPVNPPAGGPYYFLIVRPDGEPSEMFTATMKLAGWEELRKGGHTYKDKTATDAAKLGVVIPSASLPVAVLKIEPNGSRIVSYLPLPTTNEGIAKLPALGK